MNTVTVREAGQRLDLCNARIYELLKQGILHSPPRTGRSRAITVASVESYEFKRNRDKDGFEPRLPLTKPEKRAIVQTLLLAGVITSTDVADIQRERITRALKRQSQE